MQVQGGGGVSGKGMEEEMRLKAHRAKPGWGPGRNSHSSRQRCDSLSQSLRGGSLAGLNDLRVAPW